MKNNTVALVGQPNVGKSTLINEIVGQKISIVTRKVQTTRENVRGIVNINDTQLVFIDTPGIFDAKGTLERAIVNNATRSFDEADLICVILDPKHIEITNLEVLSNYLKKSPKECYAVLNKIDLLEKPEILPLIEKISSYGIFKEIFPLSADKGYGVKHFVEFLIKHAKPGPWLYDEDTLTDQTSRKLAEEITREQAFLQLHEELPYSLKVETDQYEELDNGDVKIHQSIIVSKPNHKPIALGAGGSKIKAIGQRARHEIGRTLGCKVHLFLHIKVREDWIEREHG